MFKVVAEPTFTHLVKIKTPSDFGHTEESCKATYRVLAPEEADQYDLGTTEGSTEFLRRVVIKIDDLVDGDKKPLEFNDAIFGQLLKLSYVRVALARTYFSAVTTAVAGN